MQQHERGGQVVEPLGSLGEIRAGCIRRDPEHRGHAVVIEVVPDGQAQYLDVAVVQAADHLRDDGDVPAVLLGLELGDQVLRGQCVVHYLRRRGTARNGHVVALACPGGQATGAVLVIGVLVGQRRGALAADGGVEPQAQAAIGVCGIDRGVIELADRSTQGVFDRLSRRRPFPKKFLSVIK
jgi:hypothetical protein